MKQIKLYAVWVLAFVVSIPLVAYAGMSSANFSIQASVLSGGGEPMGSANYRTDSTLCQSSPLLDQFDWPDSTSYENYPGFWYTAEACLLVGDLNGDGKVNLADFGIFRTNYGTAGPLGDLNGDGTVNLADFGIFRANYGNSCP